MAIPRVALTGALAAALAAVGSALALADTRGSASASAPSGHAVFSVRCTLSHRAPDDPIVFPGQPGASHNHDFFGNRSTTAASTDATLHRAGTTCRRREDRAAYWVPTLYVDGAPVNATHTQLYYRAAATDPASVRPHPAGLRVIAGDARATGPQPLGIVRWGCGPRRAVPLQVDPPACPPGTHLVLRVKFPECWNGSDLDSADHRGHMAYARRRACPASHPVAVPRLTMNVHYPVNDGPRVTLSSGAPYTAHADFWNTWDQGELERLVALCINASATLSTPPCSARAAPRLRLAVSPRRAIAGRRKAFRFRVQVRRAGQVVPVAGATVRFGGRRATTNDLGRARIAARLRRPGFRYAVASATDTRPGRAAVRLRRPRR